MSILKTAALKVPPIKRIWEHRNILFDENERLNAILRAQSEKGSPFYHYFTTFDAIGVMLAHAASGLKPTPGYLTNFLGVLIDPKFFPSILDGRANTVEIPPIPTNWHSDIAEWGAALRAVDLSGETFTVIELGCGWGCWLNNTGVAARTAGKNAHLIGVEGDAGHIQFAQESTATNGFSPSQVTLHNKIAAATNGTALFPRQAQAGVAWGLEPVFNATPEQTEQAVAQGSHDVLQMIAMEDVAADHARIDLLHIDIQGGEADVVETCLDTLNKKVAYTVIGTHSRQIEGRIFTTLLEAGWKLEMERPAFLALTDNGPVVTVDGLQGWRNPRLSGG